MKRALNILGVSRLLQAMRAWSQEKGNSLLAGA
jgi:hypothetical protein